MVVQDFYLTDLLKELESGRGVPLIDELYSSIEVLSQSTFIDGFSKKVKCLDKLLRRSPVEQRYNLFNLIGQQLICDNALPNLFNMDEIKFMLNLSQLIRVNPKYLRIPELLLIAIIYDLADYSSDKDKCLNKVHKIIKRNY